MAKATNIIYLEQLFVREAHDLHQDESLVAEAFGLYRNAASNPVLTDLFEIARKESETIAGQIGEHLTGEGVKARRTALRGMLDEGQTRATNLGDHHLVDAELIGSIQRLLGYQVAGYENVANYARLLGQSGMEAVLGRAIEQKRGIAAQLSQVALHQVHWRANWWAPEHTSSWDKVKMAFRRDWEQTKAHFGAATPPPGHQDAGDTVAQAAGRENVATFEADEPAFRYGYVAAQHYRDRRWDPALENELRSNYGGLWDPARDNIRAGWDYARPEEERTRESIPLTQFGDGAQPRA